MAPILERQDTTPGRDYVVEVQKGLAPLRDSASQDLGSGASLQHDWMQRTTRGQESSLFQCTP
ncbi:hypothetical protein BGZ88_005973, partial [Linnemannia elongata]